MHGAVTHAVRQHLEAFQLDQGLVGVLAATIEFVASRKLQLEQTVKVTGLNCEHDLEEFCNLAHQILSTPEPLRDFDKVISPETSVKLSLSAPDVPTPESVRTASTDSMTRAIETALRILVLMYMKTLMLKIPCGEAILLALLHQQVAIILANQTLDHIEDPFIDPTLRQESRALQRPTLIWICIAGHFFTKSWRTTYCCGIEGQLVECQVLLENVLQAWNSSTNATLVSNNDLEFCKFLDIRLLAGEHWDEREVIKDMLGLMQLE